MVYLDFNQYFFYDLDSVTLEDLPDAPWVKELGGLVPLLVAYEEELKSLKVCYLML